MLASPERAVMSEIRPFMLELRQMPGARKCKVYRCPIELAGGSGRVPRRASGRRSERRSMQAEYGNEFGATGTQRLEMLTRKPRPSSMGW